MHIIGERDIQVCFIVEVDDKHFVLRIRFAHHGHSSRFYAGAFVHHAAAVVNEDAQRNRNIFPPKNLDGLRLPVFENFESIAFQVGQQLALSIIHAGMQDHQASVGTKLRKNDRSSK